MPAIQTTYNKTAVKAQRRIVYDQFGNRTAGYDATTGGNQIQSVTISATLVPPLTLVVNNKIASVTARGATKNYSYDNAGNSGQLMSLSGSIGGQTESAS